MNHWNDDLSQDLNGKLIEILWSISKSMSRYSVVQPVLPVLPAPKKPKASCKATALKFRTCLKIITRSFLLKELSKLTRVVMFLSNTKSLHN